MSIEYLEIIKKIQTGLICYIENLHKPDMHYKFLMKIFYDYQIWNNPYEFKLLLHLICSLSNYYHRPPGFYTKIDRILHFFKEDIKEYFSNSEIFKIFKSNKRILLFLIEDEILHIDKTIANKLIQGKYKEFNYDSYFSIEIKAVISNETINQMKQTSNFKKKRVIGENHRKICTLIQSDSVEEFISYVNFNHTSLKSKIKPSIFETNIFLINKEPTLIEYAAFYGSIQIFQYLQLNRVKLTQSLWIYAIHGKNAEIIHLLEENNIVPEDETYEKCFEEAIRCHHNEIADYIRDNLLTEKIDSKSEQKKQILTPLLLNENSAVMCFRAFNFIYFPSVFTNKVVFYSREFHRAMRKSQKEILYLLLTFLEIEIDTKLAQISIDVAQTGNEKFDGCIKLVNLTMDPYNKPSIQTHPFYKCLSLNHLLISTTIKSKNEINKDKENEDEFKQTIKSSNMSISTISTNLFKGCSKLTQITIPQSVTTIEERSFEGCNSLIQIYIPKTVTSIGDSAFYGCSSLTQIRIPTSLTVIEPYTFFGCSSLKEISIPPNVTTIGDSAFRSCHLLAQVKIPNSVLMIESYAFYGCSSLTEIPIPNSVVKIGDCAFKRCSSLTKFTIPPKVTSIESYTFYGCSSLSEIIIPSNINKIGLFAFRGCSSLKEITIPSSVTMIESNAFFVCSELVKVSILSSLKSIESFTFSGCSNLKEITIPSSVTSIQDDAFFKCSSLTSINIPSSVTLIEAYSFYGCSSLKEISLPSSVTKIGNSAFRGCSSLTKFEIPSSVTSIEDHIFYDCTSLKSIKIPSSVTSIEHHAFYGCSSLIELIIPISVKSIGDDSFIRCSSLRKIYVPGDVNIDKIGIEYDVIVKKI